ncbi:acyclic terpene utilization AtuA family protein [Pacificispira sp.]|uniref:acyclic terpene utilization AtuA family protein n=1 Tax=Pacificispira sp. TaxID=2888761 RepID=UPI003B524E5B
MTNPIRIANCSGFYGDRLSAAREMIEGGPIDVLTGDWLAELTMLILAKNLAKDETTGYAKTFVRQMEDVMELVLTKNIRVVANAGGLAPHNCARAIAEIAEKKGLSPKIAVVDGDDLLPRMDELRGLGVTFPHMESGEPLPEDGVMTANAYMGGWGIANALKRGADIVVTGRVTDAAVVMGPAMWHFDWRYDDYDALAGALVAGHVIECGTQATGGNYSFFTDIPRMDDLGFPIAEIREDGSSVITKHAAHGGAVRVGTVTAQILYETDTPLYLNPDVSAYFDTICLKEVGDDRVEISGVKGAPPPETLKVCVNLEGGYRTTHTFLLTGLNIEEKAKAAEGALWAKFPGGKSYFDECDVQLVRSDRQNPDTNVAAIALLRITAKDKDKAKVGRNFFEKATEIGLASYPGLARLPAQSGSYGVFWPALVPAKHVAQRVTVDGVAEVLVPPAHDPPPNAPYFAATELPVFDAAGPTEDVPLGRIVGARSGDKGGNVNVGFWAETDEGYAWLVNFLTVERFHALVPDAAGFEVARHVLPNILAVNFVIRGLLGEGVASSSRIDPQAKGFGEYVRAKIVSIPETLLNEESL